MIRILRIPFGDFAVLHDTVDLGDHRGFARFASFEQFHHARQTAGDVLGLGRGARDLGQHVAGVNFVAIRHHQVGVHRHEIALLFRLGAALRPHLNRGNALFVGRIRHHPLRAAGDFIHLLLHGDGFLQILEVHHAADFGQDRERVRIPFEQHVVGFHLGARREQNLGAVDTG
jgi:hypothetical protein